MADTNWQDFADSASFQATDILLGMRGAGGINVPASSLLFLDPAISAARLSVMGGQVTADSDGSGYSGGCSFYSGNFRNTITGQGGWVIRNSGGVFTIYTGSNPGTAGAAFSNMAERFRIGDTGNVGINTTSPQSKLHAALGDVAPAASGDMNTGAIFSSVGGAGAINLGVNASANYSWINSAYINNSGIGSPLALMTGAVRRMVIDPSGNVGIGASSLAPGAPLDITTGAGRLHINHTATYNQLYSINAANSAFVPIAVQTTFFLPASDNAIGLGAGSNRWANIYCANSTIITSDELAKDEIGAVPDEWLDAWGAVEWVRYKFKDAIEAKGEAARWHVGLIAQRVRDVFADRDLDAQAIGLLCFDEWGEQREPVFEEQVVDTVTVVVGQEGTGVLGPDGAEIMRDVTEERDVVEEVKIGERVTLEAGDRWGLRYDECQAMEAAWQRREIARLTERLALLEAAA